MYVGTTKDVRFYENMDSKELFNELKDNGIGFNDAQENKKELLKKINEVKIGGKNSEQEKVVNNLGNFYKSREEVLNFFRDYTKMFFDASYEAKQDETKGTGLKILTPKQMLQRLPIALAQVKAGNNSESLLNEIRQIVYSLYQSKQITKKVYNNIIKSKNIQKMDTIFMNTENSKTLKSYILILKPNEKLDLRMGEKVIALSDLRIYYTRKNIKSLYNNNKFKISAPTWKDNLNYLMDCALYQIFKVVLNTF